MVEQPPPHVEEHTPETIEILAAIYQEWKRDHPNGTWKTFWAAVAAGEVEMPS
jgi:hypothetical protein